MLSIVHACNLHFKCRLSKAIGRAIVYAEVSDEILFFFFSHLGEASSCTIMVGTYDLFNGPTSSLQLLESDVQLGCKNAGIQVMDTHSELLPHKPVLS